jgi:hypothetical protein
MLLGRIVMNRGMIEGTVVTYLNILFRYSPLGTEENHKLLSQDSRSMNGKLIWCL